MPLRGVNACREWSRARLLPPSSRTNTARRTQLRVNVFVVHVRGVIVVVFDGVVSVGMGMLTDNRRLVQVVVVPVVMTMGVVVFEGVVGMAVLVTLGRVKQYAEAEQDSRSHAPRAKRSIAHPPRQRRTDERCDRENRPGASGTDAPLSQQVQPQAETVAGSAAHEQYACGSSARKRLAKAQRCRAGDQRAECALTRDHDDRVLFRQAATEGVVECPRGRCTRDRQCAEYVPLGDVRRIESQSDATEDHERKRHGDTPANGLTVQKPREQYREHGLEVQEQRAHGGPCMLEAPCEERRRDSGTDERDTQQPRQVSSAKRGARRPRHLAEQERRQTCARVEQGRRREGTQSASGARDDGRRHTEAQRREHGEPGAYCDG